MEKKHNTMISVCVCERMLYVLPDIFDIRTPPPEKNCLHRREISGTIHPRRTRMAHIRKMCGAHMRWRARVVHTEFNPTKNASGNNSFKLYVQPDRIARTHARFT